jgi:hypothetical protein
MEGEGLSSHGPGAFHRTNTMKPRTPCDDIRRAGGANMAKASFTPVGNCADSLEPLLRWSLATGHAAEILDE